MLTLTTATWPTYPSSLHPMLTRTKATWPTYPSPHPTLTRTKATWPTYPSPHPTLTRTKATWPTYPSPHPTLTRMKAMWSTLLGSLSRGHSATISAPITLQGAHEPIHGLHAWLSVSGSVRIIHSHSGMGGCQSECRQGRSIQHSSIPLQLPRSSFYRTCHLRFCQDSCTSCGGARVHGKPIKPTPLPYTHAHTRRMYLPSPFLSRRLKNVNMVSTSVQ